MLTKTQTIAGHEITLDLGRRYLALRPIAARGMTSFDVTIRDITESVDFDARPCLVIPGLSYEAANQLLNEFNNGPTSFEGRIWS